MDNEWKRAKLFYDENCKDATTRDERGVIRDCIEREKIISRDPSSQAVIMVMESYSLCGRYGCETALGSLANNIMNIVGMVLVAWVIAIFILGCCIDSNSERRRLERLSPLGGYEYMMNNGMRVNPLPIAYGSVSDSNIQYLDPMRSSGSGNGGGGGGGNSQRKSMFQSLMGTEDGKQLTKKSV